MLVLCLEILEVGNMKNLLLFLTLNAALGQTDTLVCDDSKIFGLLLDELHLSNRKNYYEIEFNYSPSPFTLKYIEDFIGLGKEEKLCVLSSFEKDTRPICTEVIQMISKLDKGKKKKGDESYMRFSFSKPIRISKKKKCVFLVVSVRNKNHADSKAIGNEMLYFFERQERKKWILSLKKSIAQY